MNLVLYRLITRALSPLIGLYLLYRRNQGKEDAQRMRERFGTASLSRPSGKLIWIHAASVGESISVLPLMHRIAELHPELSLLMTTGTVTSATLVAAKLPKNAVHQYIPVDTPAAVDRFIAHWQPDLALWIESELWPNLVTQTSRQCPIILVNARISEKSFALWQRYPSLSRSMISSFSLFLPQSLGDVMRLEQLGAGKIRHIGNLKYAAPPLAINKTELKMLTEKVKSRVLWVAASTHANEEEQFGAVHLQLKEKFPGLLTMIIPRHAARGTEIAKQLQEVGLTTALRSLHQQIEETTDVYIADTMGELGLFYSLAPIVCIGGSFIPHGGQNPLEAARLGCAIISGRQTHNFTEVYAELAAQKAVIIVDDTEALLARLTQLFETPKQQKELAKNALKAVEGTQHILDNTIKTLSPYLEPAGK